MSSIAISHSASNRPHISVFDYMRTRSHLFWRWISTHPSLHTIYHPYMMSGFLDADRILKYTRNSEARQAEHEWLRQSTPTDETHEDSNQRLAEGMGMLQGKRLLTDEHGICFANIPIQLDLVRERDNGFPPFDREIPNPVAVPNDLLDQFTPIILIRHPVLQADSLYRLLFEYFRETRGGKSPIVVDGEDVLWRTQQLGDILCKALDLPSEGLKDKWDPMPEDQKHSDWFLRATTATMTDSTGIERSIGTPEEPSLDHMAAKWTQKYGAEVAEQLKEQVEDGCHITSTWYSTSCE